MKSIPRRTALKVVLTVLTLSYAVLYPFILTQGLTLANRLNVRLRVKLSETCPLPMGVASGPFRATVFFLILSIAARGIAVLPSTRIGVTSTSSQSIGA